MMNTINSLHFDFSVIYRFPWFTAFEYAENPWTLLVWLLMYSSYDNRWIHSHGWGKNHDGYEKNHSYFYLYIRMAWNHGEGEEKNALCVGEIGDKHLVQREKEIPSAYWLRGDQKYPMHSYLREAMHMRENLRIWWGKEVYCLTKGHLVMWIWS